MREIQSGIGTRIRCGLMDKAPARKADLDSSPGNVSGSYSVEQHLKLQIVPKRAPVKDPLFRLDGPLSRHVLVVLPNIFNRIHIRCVLEPLPQCITSPPTRNAHMTRPVKSSHEAFIVSVAIHTIHMGRTISATGDNYLIGENDISPVEVLLDSIS
ncbi:hypothetical protein ANN_20456 [Periplaneta americana]|uniref:Uncharacterized protein n=1 Tax=Periplaneta americana TaxID=6978 RepID=A0ABQ8SDU3_PERAM|nr:hypothetical protein ANN_20456 [Periplaneta americana]